MRSKILVLFSVAAMGLSSPAMAGGHGGISHGGMSMHGHGHFVRHFDHRFRFFNRFNGNPFLFGGGWDWGLGGYGDNGNNTTVIVSQPPVSRFPVAGVTGATGGADPCHFNAETFTVPSSGGGTRPVQVVSCR
jgi:hypothetical protein